MAANFILVTHALTKWNVEGRIQGHTDLPLNREGRLMAECLGRYLLKEDINAVYTSDLRRAVETALPFSHLTSIKIIQDIRLREGRSVNQERSVNYPTLPFHMEVENEEGVTERMVTVMSEIARKNSGKNVLVISHGGATELFIKHVLASGKTSLRYLGVRMGLNRLIYKSGSWQCVRLDEDDHLRKRCTGAC